MAKVDIDLTGFLELTGEIQAMADEFADKYGAEGLHGMMRAAGKPVLEQAKLNCPVSPGGGTLRDSLKVVTKKKGGVYRARIGVQKGSPGYYATFVEYGHGGPHPAGPHPFLQPAYDAKKEEAYGILKKLISEKLNKYRSPA